MAAISSAFTGLLDGHMLTVGAAGALESADAGDDKAVEISNLNLGGVDARNYKLAEGGQQTSTTAKIRKAAVTVTALDQSIYVNDAVPDLSSPVPDTHYTVTGLVGEDTLTTEPTLAYQKDGSAVIPNSTTAGTYDIVASGATASDNYTITYTNGQLTISDDGSQTTYPIWVAGVQVTSENADDVLGDDHGDGPSVKFTPAQGQNPATLTLNGFENLGSTAIPSGESGTIQIAQDLVINLVGENAIENRGAASCGILAKSGSSVTITGDGTLTLEAQSCGIHAEGSVTIQSGTVDAKGGHFGIQGEGGVTIEGGTVTAEGGFNGIYSKGDVSIQDGTVNATGNDGKGINSIKNITISGGEVTAVGKGDSGVGIAAAGIMTIDAGSVDATGGLNGIFGSSGVEINGGSVTASGATRAMDTPFGKVKNAIIGAGWTDTEGTEGKAGIGVCAEGQSLDDYKKVMFPMAVATVATAPAAKALIYSGQAQALVDEGIAEGGEMQYALGTDDQTAPDASAFSPSVPTGTDAGTYYVWYRVVGDQNHVDTEPEVITAWIAEPFGEADFILPAAITTVEAEAFEGISASGVRIPEQCAIIGDYAFRNCPNLTQIEIPKDCQLGKDVFDGCGLVYVYSESGSYAETYCSASGHENCRFVPVS